MKSSISTSVAVHALLLTWGLWSLGAPEKLDMGGEAVPVELVTEVSQSMIGDEKAPQTDKPAPKPTKTESKLPMPAEHVGDNEVDLPTPPAPKAAPREVVKTAVDEAPPPPPPAAKPPEPKPPEPKAPEPKPAPAHVPEPTPTPTPPEPEQAPTEADSAPEIDPLAAEIAKAEAEKPPAPPAPPRNVPAPQAKPKPPEPVKVAEAKPEPVKEKVPEKVPEKTKATEKAKTTEASKDKPKETKKPGKSNSQNDPLEDAVLAALKNTQDTAGGGAKRSTQQASLGGKTQTGGQLSTSEMDALRGQISKCWNPPAGSTDAGSFQVKISMQLDPSGAVQGMPQIESGGGSSPAQRAAAEAAVRAVRRCAPYNLPAEKYETWADVTVNFDPSQMF